MELIQKYFTDFSQNQMQQFLALENLYIDWNEKINVISRKDTSQIYLHHVLHSLTIAAFANFSKATRVIDIGCGGGFPGIPLAIFFQNTEFLLVDSIAKKLKVVDAICTELNIKNITTKHSRVEDINGQKFDFAVSRAVAPLKDLWRWSKPLLQKAKKTNIDNGLICLKGGDLHQEISESQTRPMLVPVTDFFKEAFFEEKYLVYAKA